ncbi:MAG: alanyl-tRNA editing protein, partial [Lachnospiraceae bacterium]|nr:alanyl-tRNA editing protein [Lachnospiraceae bacterium]
MKTIPLFDQDGFIKEFTATVLDCQQVEDGWQILLDQTGFFPEGGGQTADTGTLYLEGSAEESTQMIHVLDAQKEGDSIWHKTDAPISVGSQVTGVLDWKVRFSKMQHHSGEHIVSGLVNRHFGYNNVGFHLGNHVVTLDFDGVLTREQLRQIEYEANEAVAADLPILVTYPTKEELPHLRYRSKIEIEGQVRLVEIPGYDVCACCAPHVHRTGQIGLIKLVNMENFRGGVRVYMLCGFAALADYNQKEDSVRAISQALSAR